MPPPGRRARPGRPQPRPHPSQAPLEAPEPAAAPWRQPRSRRAPGRPRSGTRGGSRRSAPAPASPPACRLSVRVVASVASTASPSAPPTCWVVLTRPEARPESSWVAPDIASVISDGKAEAGADPEQHHRRAARPRVARVDRCARKQDQACGDQRQPRDQRRSCAEAHVQPRRDPERQHRDPARATGRNAKPTSIALIAEHPLQVQRAEEEHPEQPGDHQRLDHVRARHVARAEDPQRHQRVGGPRLADDERGDQRDRDGAESERVRPSPSRSRSVSTIV